MNIIDEFINIKGIEIFNQIKQYMKDYDLEKEFEKISHDNEKLLEFSIENGIIELVKFLYEYKNLSYNFNLVIKHINFIREREIIANENPILCNYSGNSGIRIRAEDKFSVERDKCIKYLIEMRKHSKLLTKNGNFYYVYNKKKN